MDVLERLNPTTRVLKRAQYEALTFSLSEGNVLVRNESYADPENHEYTVRIEDGVPVACECPADRHAEGACKHRTAVGIRAVVLEAARTMQAVADGGQPPAQGSPAAEDGHDELEDDNPDCDCPDVPDPFPCWECVRTGRRELPER